MSSGFTPLFDDDGNVGGGSVPWWQKLNVPVVHFTKRNVIISAVSVVVLLSLIIIISVSVSGGGSSSAKNVTGGRELKSGF